MRQLTRGELPKDAAKNLKSYQARVDKEASYAGKIEAARNMFRSTNTRNNKSFRQIREALTKMSRGNNRCAYCEDSVAEDVEHFQPKSWYPELCFVWENYLYACGPCNGRKSNRFAVIAPVSGEIIHLVREPKAIPIPPVEGEPLMIDPSRENPLDFLFLDLSGTFRYLPQRRLTDQQKARAVYSIETLQLNDRAHLVEGRADAFETYWHHLTLYVRQKIDGSVADMARTRHSLLKLSFSSVWEAMKSQRHLDPGLNELLEKAPEALRWCL